MHVIIPKNIRARNDEAVRWSVGHVPRPQAEFATRIERECGVTRNRRTILGNRDGMEEARGEGAFIHFLNGHITSLREIGRNAAAGAIHKWAVFRATIIKNMKLYPKAKIPSRAIPIHN